MKKIIFLLAIAITTNSAFATVDYVTVKECRSFFWGKQLEGDTQNKINSELKEKLNASNANRVDFVQYGNEQSFFRDDKNACIIATAWFDK